MSARKAPGKWRTMQDVIQGHVDDTLVRANWNVSEAARLLVVHRRTLQRWIAGDSNRWMVAGPRATSGEATR